MVDSTVKIIPTGFKLNLKLWLKLYVSQLDTNYGLKQSGTQVIHLRLSELDQ